MIIYNSATIFVEHAFFRRTPLIASIWWVYVWLAQTFVDSDNFWLVSDSLDISNDLRSINVERKYKRPTPCCLEHRIPRVSNKWRSLQCIIIHVFKYTQWVTFYRTQSILSELHSINNQYILYIFQNYRPFSPQEIKNRASSKMGPMPYSVLWSNCEHFATWCRYGSNWSQQVGLQQFMCQLVLTNPLFGANPTDIGISIVHKSTF